MALRLQSLGIDLDRTAISKIESGKRPITDVETIAICRALGVETASMFTEL